MKRALLIAIALVACKKSGGGASSRDGLIDAWKGAGLTTSAFTAAKTQVGEDCQTGTVNSVDVLVCSFGNADAAKAAEPNAYKWVGDTTGQVQVKGTMVIAAADRKKADPSGRTINQIIKAAK